MPYVMSMHLLTYILDLHVCTYMPTSIPIYCIIFGIIYMYIYTYNKIFCNSPYLQKKTMIIVCNVGYRDYANELFCNLKCLKKCELLLNLDVKCGRYKNVK